VSPAIRLVLVFALAAVVSAPAPAAAQPASKIGCDFLEITASTSAEGKIPSELKPLEKKLKKPPFSSWNTFKLLSRASRSLELLKADTLKLTMGQATVLFRDADQRGKKSKIALTVTIDDEHGKRVVDTKVSVIAGDYLVLGRSLPNNEGHLLAMTCK
jgi:hypothetical protein